MNPEMFKPETTHLERLLCRFGWHQWLRWSRAVPYGFGYMKQARVCVGCNKAQTRTFSL